MEDQEDLMEGYPKLAALMGKYPILSIYRRFSVLNSRNLLYLQAELIALEDKLKEYTLEDIQSADEKILRHARNWQFLGHAPVGNPSCAQWHTMLAIRDKLKEYNECLLQQRQLATFSRPDPGNLEFLENWLRHPKFGKQALSGPDRNVWIDGKDLLVVAPDSINDSFSRLMRKRVLELYHHIFGSQFRAPSDTENEFYFYDEKTVLRLADIIGTIISALLPVVSVVVLYCVKNMRVRLGLVAVFTVLFSLVLSLIAPAKRVEVFAATAAFTSVQVVFLGSITN
ncbi:uncharacterized protein PAC_18030 [Phialocephala subalpina]|uniref:DUF6594 domain-containing protein n=1 Tax=Phialocephala subalpina TaxID=576137 RepID=A0A1L7XSW4_9HELO|nr:uncharacterized protein PAC_18030 [Phialocephala subalpina]